MKVLFVHDGPLYTDNMGNYFGVHLKDALRARYLKLGESVTFMIRTAPLDKSASASYSAIKNENFKVVSVPNFKSIRLYFNKLKARKIIKETVKDHDIIVARLPSAIGKIAVQYAKAYDKPLLIEFVGCTFDTYWHLNWKGKIIAHFKMYQHKKLMRDISYCVYVTREFLQNRYPCKGTSINCSNVELQSLEEKHLNERVEGILQRNSSTPLTLATVGALNIKYKGQGDVIKAISILKKEGLNFYYRLIGQGDQSYLKNLTIKYGVEDLVTLVGPLKHDEVFAYLKDIDIYIQPSKTEGLPRAPIEAMSVACPVIGSNAGGIPELLDPEMIFEAGNIQEIVKKLKLLNKETMIHQAERNFEEAKLYQKNVLEEKRMAFYNNFLLENFN